MIKKRAILFTTFGSTRSEVMEPILDCFVSEGADRWPDRWIEAVITGEHVRRALAERGVSTESLEEALDRLSDEGFVEVTVQPLLINDGGEYEKVRRRIQAYVDRTIKIIKIRLGRPLLWSHEDMERLADILCTGTAADPEQPLQKTVYIGHGTGGSSDERYRILERKFADRGRSDICIELLKSKRISAEGCRKPLMLMAGAHAEEAQCELTGLGENPLIRSIFLDHAEQATLIRRNSSPLEALILTKAQTPLSQMPNNLGLDETKILACTDLRQALMIQELQNQELFPDCELELVEGDLAAVIAMIDGLGADDCGEAGCQSDYAGLICSCSDLKALSLEHRIRAIFTAEEIVPAMGSGSVNAIEAMAMQAFINELELSPESITSVYAEGDMDGLELWAIYYDEESGQWWTDWIVGDPEDPTLSGQEFARQICQGGMWTEEDNEEWEE
ncbi:MAG: sirohydrochlorin cobaltochelatase [Firmicutes bacterium]|nr:sirohydrochlorin cobaltochelatase [Bacillota bacterium]